MIFNQFLIQRRSLLIYHLSHCQILRHFSFTKIFDDISFKQASNLNKNSLNCKMPRNPTMTDPAGKMCGKVTFPVCKWIRVWLSRHGDHADNSTNHRANRRVHLISGSKERKRRHACNYTHLASPGCGVRPHQPPPPPVFPRNRRVIYYPTVLTANNTVVKLSKHVCPRCWRFNN